MKVANYNFHIVSYHWHFLLQDSLHREHLINYYNPWFEIVIKNFFSTHKYPLSEFHDYFNFGYIGFLQAIDRFNTCYGVKFETFAEPYIRGSILKGLSPYVKDLPLHSKFTTNFDDAFDQVIDSVIGLAFGRFLELGVLEDAASVENDYFSSSEFSANLLTVVDNLSGLEKQVIELYYFKAISFKEIADLLALSKGRISQIHSSALANMRIQFKLLL